MSLWEWLMGSPPGPEGRSIPTRPIATASAADKRTHPLHLQLGDVVGLHGVDYLITNKITYEEDGSTWLDYLLMDEATQSEWWLSAEEDDGLQLGLFQEIELELKGGPPKEFNWEGTRYKQVEASQASVTLEEEDEGRSHDKVWYWEYEASKERYATILKWGERFEASAGKSIRRTDLTIYPRA